MKKLFALGLAMLLVPALVARAADAKETYDKECAKCHGADGKGNKALGAPNLTDKYWLYGGSLDAVVAQITNGRTSTMPPQGRLLTPEQVQVLAAYVWGLAQPARVAAN